MRVRPGSAADLAGRAYSALQILAELNWPGKRKWCLLLLRWEEIRGIGRAMGRRMACISSVKPTKICSVSCDDSIFHSEVLNIQVRIIRDWKTTWRTWIMDKL